jgi:hypothetical protein
MRGQGNHKGCPYRHLSGGFHDDDPVDVIRHDAEYIQFDGGKPNRHCIPFLQDDPSRVVQVHLTIDYASEEARPILYADGNEIRSGLRIIVPFQAKGSAMVFL